MVSSSVLAATSSAAIATAKDDGLRLDHHSVLAAIRDLDGLTTVVASPAAPAEAPMEMEPDALVVAIARAFRWQEQLESGHSAPVSALANREGVDEAVIRRALQLSLLQPSEIEAILNGTAVVRTLKDA